MAVRRAAALALALVGFLRTAAAAPVIKPGHEAEVERLFSGVGKEALAGWKVPSIEIPFDRIRAELEGPQGELLVVELRHPQNRADSVGHTESFEVFLVSRQGLSDQAARPLLDYLVASLAERDNGSFWQVAGTEDAPDEIQLPGLHAFIVIAWQAAFVILAATGLALFIRLKSWRNGGGLACLVIAAAALAAFLLRWWVIAPGPAQLVARIPDSADLPTQYPYFGCGYHAWILGWYWMIGASDQTAFLAGAVIGSLGVVSAAVLAGAGGGGRVAGAAAACLLALWSIHARLSPTDDPAGLIATLICTALALMAVAARSASRLALCAGWLAGFLAALTRPELVLALAALAGLVLLDRRLRRLQFGAATLAAFGLMAVVSSAGIGYSIHWAAQGGFDALACATDHNAIELFDLLFGGSILSPPRTQAVLTFLFVGGLVISLSRTRGKSLLWLAAGMLPAVPTGCMLVAADIVTARYQLALAPLAAACGGFLVGWTVDRWWLLGRRWFVAAAAVGALLLGAGTAVHFVRPPPEPTFRLEYFFFRRHLPQIPAGCRLVHIQWPTRDLGLRVPTHLSSLLGLDHQWVEPAAELDPGKGCLVYWQPASCRAENPDFMGEDVTLPECRLIENSFRLVPIATAALPARTGFCEHYTVDPVPVGFYQLLPKD